MDLFAHIRIFIDIADQGSLAGAARARSLAPSAVTASLRRLEEHLGTRLISRSTRSLAFTPEGAQFLEQCRHIVRELDDACDQVAGGGPLKGTIRITSLNDFGRSRLATLIDAFLAWHPNVTIDLSLGDKVIVVADRGLLSLDNIEQLSRIVLPSGKKLEFILAVPGRRYADFAELLQPLHDQARDQAHESVQELAWAGHRLVVAHDPHKGQEQTNTRRQRIAELEQRAAQLAGKLDAQEVGQKSRGRKMSDSGAKARFYREVCEAHLASIIRVDLQSALFTYEIHEPALQRAQMMDGKLLMVTNVPGEDLPAHEVLARYKSLADIERGFRVLKSDIEIAPVYHRLPQRIRAHASICFMALILHRVMRMRLKRAQHPDSPQTALQLLRRVQRQTVRINDAHPVTGVSSINEQQRALMAALGLKKLPQEGGQMNLV